MKLFKDTKTGEVFVKLFEETDTSISLKDNRTVKDSDMNLKEFVPGCTCGTIAHHRIVEDSLSVGCIEETDFHLKDVIYVPVGNENIAFRVEHITDEKVYFVATDIVGKSTMNDMDEFLKEFESRLPYDLVCKMVDIEHCVDGKTNKNKISLLSYGNLVDCDRCTGKDEMVFDGLATEAERCKNFDGETEWYWTDTPNAGNSTNFMVVSYHGYPGYYYSAYNTNGVVPCFAIKKR